MPEDSKEETSPTSTVPPSQSQSPRFDSFDTQRINIEHDQQLGQAVSTEEDQPPPYGELFGHIENDQEDLGTRANIADDGRVNIRIHQKSTRLSNIFRPAFQSRPEQHPDQVPYVPPTLGRRADRSKPPSLNVVIHVVGSRGDVQPFVALGKVLREQYGHRVRLATHETFRDFVEQNGLEFFCIGGDPSQLMAFMVKNPGLMPGFDTLRSGDVGHRRGEIAKIVKGCWRSCIESGDGTGPVASDEAVEDWASLNIGVGMDAPSKPFVADAIIANPPSFAHVHCAEKLGTPLHMMFTMPWSPTQAFPHPLANVQATNADASLTNFMTYALVDMMTWQGLGDVINRFRRKSLGLDPISLTWAPGMLARLKVPWTYCWSPALIPKPRDWPSHISISGFYFLNLASNYAPAPDLDAFLKAGPPPVYIGFGSIVLDDPNGMTRLIFDAVAQSGQRALVSKGWGGFGTDEIGVPENVFMLGNVPHDWLFQRVSCVVHHGGAGTTAAGIAAGKPTVIVPFFGDQPFWGSMVSRAGAGPDPIPSKDLTADVLSSAIKKALTPACAEKAKELSQRISQESGSESGAESFHHELDVDRLRCQLSPTRPAVWRIRRTDFRLSAFAATILAHERLLDTKDLKLYRPQEYEPDDGPWDPVTGGATALIETMGSMAMGLADMPVATLKALKIHPDVQKGDSESRSSSRSRTPSHSRQDSKSVSTADLKATRTEALQSIDGNRTRSSSVSSGKSSVPEEEVATAHALGGTMMHEKSDQQNGSPGVQSRASTANTAEKQKPFKFNQEDLETVLSTGKGAWRFTEAGVKSPLDFTLALAKGFHNAPKLYGDDTVRKPEKITNLSSGIKAAGREFGYGLYDGITGLATQPIKGAKKEGPAGFVKGFGKGLGGIVLKPGAGFWGIPGFAAQGLYRELRNRFGPSVEGYIVAARTAQGYDEMQKASSEEYDQLIKDWDDIKHLIRKKKNVGEEKMEEIKGRMRDVRSRSRSASAATKSSLSSSTSQHPHFKNSTNPGTNGRQLLGTEGLHTGSIPSGPSRPAQSQILRNAGVPPPKYDALTNDPEFEEAIKKSIAETSQGNSEEDSVIEKAIRASVMELEEAKARGAGDDELNQAMKTSLAEAKRGNLDRKKADAASAQATGANSGAAQSEEEQDFERAITASKSTVPATEDDQLTLAITQSKEAHNKLTAEQQEAANEEEIVMRYVMKQSEEEEKLRRQRTEGPST